MIDWKRIVGFDWDAGNARKSVDKQAVSQVETEQVFFNEPLLMAPDVEHSATERRIHALGCTDEGRLLHITFTLRDKETKIRMISAGDMSRNERSSYEQQS